MITKRKKKTIPLKTMAATTLRVRPISEGVKKAILYIENRKNGKLRSLVTSFKKLNNALLEGID